MAASEEILRSTLNGAAPAPAASERSLVPTSAQQIQTLGASPTTQRSLVPMSALSTAAAPGAPAGPPAPPPSAPAPGTTTTPTVSTPVLSSVQDQETVRGQLRQILDEGSPILDQARMGAQRFAAGRGLQNSTLAAQAGESAVISAAVPIAAADAATHSERAIVNQNTQNAFGQAQQEFEHTQQLATQDHLQRMVEQAQAGDINSRLQLEQFGYNSQLSVQENLQRMEQMRLEGDIQGTLALQQFNYQTMLASQAQGHALELENAQFQNNQRLIVEEYAQRMGLSAQEAQQEVERLNTLHRNTLEEISAQSAGAANQDAARFTRDLQTSYLNAVTQRQMAASLEIQGIYTTQGLTSAQQSQAVAVARQRLEADLLAVAAYYQQSPAWDPNWGGGTGGTPPPAGTPGGAGGSPVPTTPGGMQVPTPGTFMPPPPAPGQARTPRERYEDRYDQWRGET